MKQYTKQCNVVMGVLMFLASVLLAMGLFFIKPTANNTLVKADDEAPAKVQMLEGASIRYSAPAGIRFTAYVNDSCFETGTDTLLDGVTVGMKISATDSASTAKNWDINSDEYTLVWAKSDLDGYHMFQVALVGEEAFPASEYATEITAQAYVTDSEGTAEAVAQTRSIAQVANACLAENKVLEYIGSARLTAERKTALDAYTAATTVLNMDNHFALEGDAFTWTPVANAKGYFVRYGDKVLHVIENGETTKYSLPVSAFGEVVTTNGEANICPYGDGTNYSFPTLGLNRIAIYKTDVNGGVVNGVTKGFVTNFNPINDNGQVNVSYNEEEAGVAVQVNSSGSRSVFGLSVADGLDLTNHAGLKITFKVLESNYIDVTTFGLQLVGKKISNTGYFDEAGTVIGLTTTELGGTATMYLTNKELATFYEDGDKHIALKQQVTLPTSGENTSQNYKKTKFILKEISYYDVTDPAERLASFADENNGTISYISGYGYTTYQTEPSYEYGTVKAGFYFDRYHADGGSTLLAACKVTLPKGLDLSKDGIVIRVQVYNKTSSLSVDNFDSFTLLTKDGQKTWQSGASTNFPGVTMTYQESMELKITAADLQSMGYATGDTELYFGGWIKESVQKHLGYCIYFQLDDISYYSDEE